MARSINKKRVEEKAVLIAFEDSKSSKYYFRDLLRDKKLTGQVILVNRDKGQDPKRVFEKIGEYKNKNPNEVFEKEWIVIDKDNWSKDKYLGVMERARKEDICVAFSNDAYELWIILHFEPLTRPTHRTELNSKLNTIFLERYGKKYEKSSQDIYKFIIGFQEVAIKNAKNLVKQHHRDYGKIDPEKNPITMIYQLVECLNSLYDKERKCNCFPMVDM
ncbi:RloB family protein [bacterium]|nr:RloB family protein [bacterium]MBU1958749.1 RloB family protein [bacterium]